MCRRHLAEQGWVEPPVVLCSGDEGHHGG
jgi:hypothetical protein